MTTTTYPNKPYLNERLQPNSTVTFDELGTLLDDAADLGITLEGQLHYSREWTNRRPSGPLTVKRYEGYEGHEVYLRFRDRKRQATGIVRNCGARECLRVKDNKGRYTIKVTD
jgi:hypothetical protein